jgi:hypothetical protein
MWWTASKRANAGPVLALDNPEAPIDIRDAALRLMRL